LEKKGKAKEAQGTTFGPVEDLTGKKGGRGRRERSKQNNIGQKAIKKQFMADHKRAKGHRFSKPNMDSQETASRLYERELEEEVLELGGGEKSHSFGANAVGTVTKKKKKKEQ